MHLLTALLLFSGVSSSSRSSRQPSDCTCTLIGVRLFRFPPLPEGVVELEDGCSSPRDSVLGGMLRRFHSPPPGDDWRSCCCCCLLWSCCCCLSTPLAISEMDAVVQLLDMEGLAEEEEEEAAVDGEVAATAAATARGSKSSSKMFEDLTSLTTAAASPSAESPAGGSRWMVPDLTCQ